MFEWINGIHPEEWRLTFISVMVGAALIVFAIWAATNEYPIETHYMGNGVICYTSNTGIDCLQVEK